MFCGHTGLVSLAETPVPMGIKEDPHSPDEDPRKEGADKQISPIECPWRGRGPCWARGGRPYGQSEQRAMQELHRFQKHSMPTTQTEDVESASVQTQPTAAKAARPATLGAPGCIVRQSAH